MVFGEMNINDPAGKAAVSLAIAEKRQAPRPGGCVGIFFQLFDWHRRFAKKKLFSRKLLPPARPKQASRNLKGDEKMPAAKLHYIADENKGGVPNLRQNDNLDMVLARRHEMGAPSLVARLMGLESIPTVRREKSKKALSCESYNDKASRFAASNKGLDGEDLNSEKGQIKHERPQKLQKTGLSERRAVTRFGAEALQIKGVLSRSRKHNHPKIPSPVKSPRISSARSVSRTSRLMIDAATRILEPGMQAKNRAAKYGITYTTPTHYASQSEGSVESPVGQSSCKNCGTMLNVGNFSQKVEDQTPKCAATVSASSFDGSYQGFGMNKTRQAVSMANEETVFYKQRQHEQVALTPQVHHEQAQNRLAKDTRELFLEQWHLPTRKNTSQRDDSSSDALNSHSPQNQMSPGGEIVSSAKLGNLKSRRVSSAANSVSGAKDFIALNRSLSGRTRPRVLSKAENTRAEAVRKPRVRRDDSPSQSRSPVRKMRAVNVNETVESASPSSATTKQRKDQCDASTGKEMEHRAHPTGKSCIRRDSGHERECIKASGSEKSNVISFTFNSPLKHKNGTSMEVVDERIPKVDSVLQVADSVESTKDGCDKKASLRKQLAMRGDALGALLEQKLKELASQEEDEMNNACVTPKRSTAMILQDLIAALTADPLLSEDCDMMIDTEKAFQINAMKEGRLVGLSNDANPFSPGSVLDASFSNESCVSSSFDDNSGLNLELESMDFSCDLPQPLDLDDDLSDSTGSLSKERTSRNVVTTLIGWINKLFSQLYLAGVRLEGSKLIHAKEVNLHAELVFSDGSRLSSDGTDDFILNPFLLDELECLATSTWTIISGFSSLDTKDRTQLREFLFDCLLECLDSKYRPCCDFGYRGWRRLPSALTAETLIRDVEVGLKKWESLSGMSVDEMIEWEMSHSLGKWLDFDTEAFENGIEIEKDILQDMVDEIMVDLC